MTTKEADEVDFFNTLPDDIIVSILCRLTISEAARTSILSVRWRHLWTFFSASLDFDASNILHRLRLCERHDDHERVSLEEELDGFKRIVYKVLNSLQAQTLESFLLCFDVVGSDGDIDNWVQFAIQKRVKKLVVDLVPSYLAYFPTYEHCVVPPSLVNLSSLPCLRVLRLSHVDVSGKDVKNFLSSCPLLETLSVVSSRKMKRLKICDSHAKLRELEIRQCFNLQRVEISCGSLVSFTYTGRPTGINYVRVPNLREVVFGGARVDHTFTNFFRSIGYDHSQYLRVLKLELYLTFQFWKVRDLDGPFICTEVHALDWLQEVKLIGFCDGNSDVAFIQYIIENATNLKKLIVDPISPLYPTFTFEDEVISQTTNDDFTARIIRMHELLVPLIPPCVEFVIL
ncbi:putative F-box/LRR-repeat protein [Senna tora]|uniref:Putative F-box/LRR-repeat protein n=1 Tax=Senna tora TaxID=362788 RepID=A0A834SIX8_9FABA|nr:putative F-box/LRR-repeat protein [Senna tora]